MSSTDLHEVLFEWPHPEPSTVIVTGTFDQWASSIRLDKTSTGFQTTTRIPWNEKIKYKFIVDGQWIVHENQPTEVDPGGYVNNVYISPPKPTTTPEALVTGPVAALGETSVAINPELVGDDQPAGQVNGDIKNTVNRSTTVSDIASTVAARDGTMSAVGYVTSAIGAVIQNVVGIDPVNSDKIASSPAQDDAHFEKSPSIPSTDKAELSSPKVVDASSHVAPIVPITIVPVNAPENNDLDKAPNGESVQDEPVALESSETPTKELSTHAPVTHQATPITTSQIDETALNEGSPTTVSVTTPIDSQPKVETNGHSTSTPPPSTAPPHSTAPHALSSTSAPSTPSKSSRHAFPRESLESPASSINQSPASTKSGRKKKTSIFSKLSLKSLFHHDKDKKKTHD